MVEVFKCGSSKATKEWTDAMADIEFSEMVCHSAGDTKQERKG